MSNSMVISIIGRPNVGKSSLFNKLMRSASKAITFNIPGVTRDRHYDVLKLEDLTGENICETILVDTGGFYPDRIEEEKDNYDKFFNIMADHAKEAINESDLVLFVMDVREGILPFDRAIADYLRSQKKEFWAIVNKYDSDKQMGEEAEFYSLGISQEDLFVTSTAHNIGIETLRDSLYNKAIMIKERVENSFDGISPNHEVISSLAIIGAPNAGKSTLLNQLLKSNRALVSDIPGTTVDPINGYFDIDFDGEKKSVKILDTAGIRRKSIISTTVETQSVFRALRAITDSDIVIYMVDATKGLAHQDKRLLDIALEKGKSIMIGLNKSDLLDPQVKQGRARTEWLQDLRDVIPWLEYVDLITISAKYNKNIGTLKKSIIKTIKIRSNKIPTSELNRAVGELIKRKTIMIKGSHSSQFKLRYTSMLKANPPTFILFTNRVKDIPSHYKSYLKNGLRSRFDFSNTPIHLIFRSGK